MPRKKKEVAPNKIRSNLAPHRIATNSTAELKVRVSPITHAALKQYMAEYVLSTDTVVWDLIEFYRLNNLQLLIERLHAKYQAGLSPVERGQYSILYTMLAEIDRVSGL
jgi:hypothetical protein